MTFVRTTSIRKLKKKQQTQQNSVFQHRTSGFTPSVDAVSITDSVLTKLLVLLSQREHRLLQTLLRCPAQRASKLYLLYFDAAAALGAEQDLSCTILE